MRQSLSPYRGEVYRLPSEGVRLYPLGQYRIVVNQDYIGLSKEYSFHVFGAILSGYRTIEHWFSIGSLTPILS